MREVIPLVMTWLLLWRGGGTGIILISKYTVCATVGGPGFVDFEIWVGTKDDWIGNKRARIPMCVESDSINLR